MPYETAEIVKMMQTYNELESAAKDFLFTAGFASKHKAQSAQKVLKAIEEYKKIPTEIRMALEKNPNSSLKSLAELERLCKKAVEDKKN
jgi:hypothetical protein